jgi:hypothetical protein
MIEQKVSRNELNNLEPRLFSGERINTGGIELVTKIPSLTKNKETGQLEQAEFRRFRNHIEYPPKMVEALNILLERYNSAFTRVLQLRQPDAYPLAYHNGNFTNMMVQVDMRGLPLGFLETIGDIPTEELAGVLNSLLYEAENSLAMYGMMRGIFSPDAQTQYSPQSFFGVNFDSALDLYKKLTGRPLVLAAVTEAKWQSMLNSEFGTENLSSDNELTPEKVRLLSGFDRFVGPERLKRLLSKKDPQILLYMRTSYPASWLKNPAKEQLSIPILEDDGLREKIRELAITPNIDDPKGVNWFLNAISTGQFKMVSDSEYGFVLIPNVFEGKGGVVVGIINDTKEYLRFMDPERRRLVVDPAQVNELFSNNENIAVRLKPAFLHYGVYGHHRILLGEEKKKRKEVFDNFRSDMKRRGPYILEPELLDYSFSDEEGQEWKASHRLFLAYDPRDSRYKFIGGLFNAEPANSEEARKGRLHGSDVTVWGQIVVRDENQIVNPDSLNYVLGSSMSKID